MRQIYKKGMKQRNQIQSSHFKVSSIQVEFISLTNGIIHKISHNTLFRVNVRHDIQFKRVTIVVDTQKRCQLNYS